MCYKRSNNLCVRLEFRTPADDDLEDGGGSGPRIQLNRAGRSLESRALAGGDLRPVMARLGPVDLETLDALITAGIAANRADAVAGPSPASASGQPTLSSASGPERSSGSSRARRGRKRV
ncbi:MAG: hypothetical protein ACRDN0_39350, partial [Trebonia sp.]